MENSKIGLLAALTIATSVCVSPAQTLLVRMPLTDTGSGTTCASDTSTGGANVTLNMLNNAGTAADFHGVPGGGVSGLNVALDFSSNADFSGGNGVDMEGGQSLGGAAFNGPIAENLGSTALNFPTITAFTATIWFKANSLMNNTVNHGPRIFVLGANGTADKSAANSIGLYWQATNEIGATLDTAGAVEATLGTPNFTVGQWYFYAITFDGTTLTIYEGTDNGAGATAVATSTADAGLSVTLTNASGSVLFLGNATSRGRCFDGWLNDFRLYNSAGTANFVEDIRWSALAPIVTAAPGNNEAVLNFTNLTGAASYTVYRSTSPTGPFNTSPSGGTGLTSPTFTDTTAANGTTYYYEVTAVDANGDQQTSQYSQPVGVTPEAPPTTPQFVTATASNAAVFLSWTASTGTPAPITYNLAKSTTSGSEVVITNTTATSYVDTNVVNGTEYFYTVTAFSGSQEASATSLETNSTPTGPPAAPAEVYADVSASGGVLVSWTAVPGATSYNILRSTTGPSGAYSSIATGQTGTSYSDPSGVLGDYYEVAAVGPGGTSADSSSAKTVPTLLNVNFDSPANGNNYGGGTVPPPSAMSGAAEIGSPGDIWNGVNDGGADPATYTAGPLVNADGSSSPVTLSLYAPGGEFDDNCDVGFSSFSPFSWASQADLNNDIGYPNSPYAVLMATLLSSGGGYGYVQLGGLTPNATYTLYVYSSGNAAGRTSTFWVTNGTTQTNSCTYDDRTITLVNGVDYVLFTNVVADVNGDMVINWGNGVSENDFCGFQLIEGVVLGATISSPPDLNGLTLCTNTSVTFTASSGSVGGVPTTTIVSFTNIVTTSVLGSPVTTSTTNVYTANGTFSGTVVAGISSSPATLTMPLLPNLKYRVTVTAVPASGTPLVTTTTFDTFAPALVVEASDYNFNGGSWLETPANGGVWFYSNQVATAGIDFYKGGGEGPNALFYRDLTIGNAPYVTEANADTFSEQKDAVATTGDGLGTNDFPELAIGYSTPGDWWNYTRTYGASGYPVDSTSNGTYNVWLYMAEGGTGGQQASLSLVTPSPANSQNQTLTQLGQFGFASFAEADWNGYEYVPLTDTYGNIRSITVGSGEQTLQLKLGPANPNVGFLMLMPATPVLTPGLSYIYPNGQPFEPTNLFAFTVTPNNGSNILASGIDLVLNGVDVSTGLTITPAVGNTWNVSYPLQYNTVYAAVINVTNSAGVYSTFTYNFDTFNPNFYQWEAVDYDFSTNNGTIWVGAQFIDNPVPTADINSTVNTEALGHEATNSYYGFPMNYNPGVDPYSLGAVAQQGIDINVTANGQGPGQYLYRANDNVGNQVTTDYLRAKFKAAQTNFNDPNIGIYNVGYIAAGNWFNYTRHYPAGSYYVWGRLAANANTPYGLTLGQVTSGAGTATQTVTPLGTFTGTNGTGYQSWQWIPLLDANNNPVVVALNGQATTFQAQATSGLNMEYFMLVPAPLKFTLTPSNVAGQFKISFPTQTGYSYQVQFSSSLTAPSWSSVGSSIPGDGTVHTVPVSSSPASGFYRVMATP